MTSNRSLFIVEQCGEPLKPGNPDMSKDLRIAFATLESAQEAVEYEMSMGTPDLEVIEYVRK